MKTQEIPAINRRIRDIRHALGLSQIKFSSIVALSNGYLARVETGHITVNERLVKLVCSSFRVNETYLRYVEGETFNEEITDDKFKNLVTLVKALPPKFLLRKNRPSHREGRNKGARGARQSAVKTVC